MDALREKKIIHRIIDRLDKRINGLYKLRGRLLKRYEEELVGHRYKVRSQELTENDTLRIWYFYVDERLSFCIALHWVLRYDEVLNICTRIHQVILGEPYEGMFTSAEALMFEEVKEK